MTLISRLESATQGSRELDALIWARVCSPTDLDKYGLAEGWAAEYEPDADGSVRMYARKGSETHLRARRAAPHYTTSIDVALTLVPDGFAWRVKATNVEGAMEYSGQVNYEKPSYAATPALALCIAALKARSAP